MQLLQEADRKLYISLEGLGITRCTLVRNRRGSGVGVKDADALHMDDSNT
jgi:hypothetical protein